MTDFDRLDAYLEEHLDESIVELSRLVAQPSVGAQNWGLAECAELVASMLRQRGFATQVMPTGGAPVVFGERAGRSPKTLLIYNHYDVQPPEPLELWDSPPFQPELRDGKLFGRGVSDDKGQLVSRLFAIDAVFGYPGRVALYGEVHRRGRGRNQLCPPARLCLSTSGFAGGGRLPVGIWRGGSP